LPISIGLYSNAFFLLIPITTRMHFVMNISRM